jgi:hypothetical protein
MLVDHCACDQAAARRRKVDAVPFFSVAKRDPRCRLGRVPLPVAKSAVARLARLDGVRPGRQMLDRKLPLLIGGNRPDADPRREEPHRRAHQRFP